MRPSVEISVVEGFERDWRVPEKLRDAGLTRRVAVVQETYVPDHLDMYFDDALFLALVDFTAAAAPGGRIGLASRMEDIGRREISPDEFRADWAGRPEAERDPAAAIIARVDGRLILAVVTEFWTSVGGPRPYADSYTYSVLSDRQLGDDLRAFLSTGPEAERWTVIPAVLDHPVSEDLPPPRSGWLRRLFG